MDRHRIWMVGAAVLMVGIAALGWILGIQPQLDAASAATQQRANVESTNQANAAVLAKLRTDFAAIGSLRSKLSGLLASVPADAGGASFLAELDSITAANHVQLWNLAITDAQPYAAVAGAAAAAGAPATSANSPTATPTPTPGAAPAKAPAVTSPSQAGIPVFTSPLITSKNFAVIPVKLKVVGTLAQVDAFMHDLQTKSRLFLVTTATIAPSSSASDFPPTPTSSMDANLSGYVFGLSDPTLASAKVAG